MQYNPLEMSAGRHKGWSDDKEPVHPESPAGGGGPGGFKQPLPHGIDPFDEFTVGELVDMGVLPQNGPVTPEGHRLADPAHYIDPYLIILRTSTDLITLNAAGLAAARSIEEFSRMAAAQAAYRLQRDVAVQLNAAARLARQLTKELVAAGKPVVANVGGAGEEAGAINVNNQVIPRSGIPNLVQADGAEIGELFAPGSLDGVVGNNMAPGVLNWSKAATGAFRALKSGGTVRYYYRGANKDALVAAQELRRAGFTNVKVIRTVKPLPGGGYAESLDDGVGVEATKP